MYINWTNISGSLYGAYIPNSLHNVASSDLALAHTSLYSLSRPSLPFYSRLGKHVCMYTHVHKMVFQMKLRIRNVAVKPERERERELNKVNGISQYLLSYKTNNIQPGRQWRQQMRPALLLIEANKIRRMSN